MKILVLSLLRLGDVIQQGSLLKGLRRQYPEAEIHLLLNRQFSQVEKILDGVVDRYIYFDRDALQKGLGEIGYNVLWSYSHLESLISRLNAESYDMAINLTHNKLSGYLLGALQIKEKRGLYQQNGRFQGLSNRWLRYFNDRFSGTHNSLFHYVELLGNAFGIPVDSQEVTGSTEKSSKRTKLVLLQCLTSDTKKNWGLERFNQLKRIIEVSLVDYKVCVLGAPFEREKLLEVFAEKDLLICDLVEAREHLKSAALLVTGDTSIKHLAAQAGSPIVEIVIGSSDAIKTSAFSKQTVILQSQIPCAPCGHTQSCSQASHLCAEDISVERVFEAVWNQLSGEKIASTKLKQVLEKSVWSLYLDKEHAESEPVYRTAIEDLLRRYPVEAISEALPDWTVRTQTYRKWLNKSLRALPARDVFLTKRHFQSADIAELILCAQDILKSKMDEAGYFSALVDALLSRFSHPVQIFDRAQEAIKEIEEILIVRETFTHHLQTFSKEGAYYAKGIGQLSISGFEETGKSLQRDFENAGLQPRSRESAAP